MPFRKGMAMSPKLCIMAGAALGVLAACTSYNEDKWYKGGGYTETPLAANTYRIDVRANAYTTPDRARKIALVRCADLTLRDGYDRFIIVGADSQELQQFAGFMPGYYSSSTNATARMVGNAVKGSATTSGFYTPATPLILNEPRVAFVVRMVRPDDPEYANGLDARQIINTYGESVGRKKQ